jgi:hypothetical protein
VIIIHFPNGKSEGENVLQEKRIQNTCRFSYSSMVLLLALSLALLSILLSLFASNPQGQSVSSLSWAGYIIAKNSANPQLEVIAINASWIAPKVNVSAGDGYSSAWIRIGGQSDKTLIQVGTEHDVVNG